MRPITINGGMQMRAWYDISGMEIAQKQDEAGIRDSVRLLNELVEQEIARGIPSENIFLAGFSQGGAIALAGGVRSKHKLRGTPEWQAFMKDGAYNTTFLTGDEFKQWLKQAAAEHRMLMEKAGFLARR